MAERIMEDIKPDDTVAILGSINQQRERQEQALQGGSEFERTLIRMNYWQNQPPSPEQNQAFSREVSERDRLLEEAGTEGLFDPVKNLLYFTYRRSRVNVPPSRKEEQLSSLMQSQQEAERESLENDEFWDNPARSYLKNKYKGAIDYFRRNSLTLIRAAVENPQSGPFSGVLVDLWNLNRPDLRTGAPVQIRDFNHLREIVETERAEKVYVPSYGNYRSYIEFLAETPDELEKILPAFTEMMFGEIGSDEAERLYKGLDELKELAIRATAEFKRGRYENDPQVRWIISEMIADVALRGTDFFAEKFEENSQYYYHFLRGITTGFEYSKEGRNDHYGDVLLFDKYGYTVLGGTLLNGEVDEQGGALTPAQKFGIFFRFGKDSGDKPLQGEREAYQDSERDRFVEIMATHRLRRMGDLLASADPNDPNGPPQHPLFRRVWEKLKIADGNDPNRNQPGFEPRWVEYKRKAAEWERIGIPQDNRNPQARVRFEHPLARAMKVPEALAMFEKRQFPPEELEQRKKLARRYLKRSEMLAKAFQLDARWGGPRHVIEGRGVVAHTELLKEELDKALALDRSQPFAKKRFKLHYLLTEKVGLDLAFPLYGGWDLGADDGVREAFLSSVKDACTADEWNKIEDALNGVDPSASPIPRWVVKDNQKLTVVRWAEEERRMIMAVEYGIKVSKELRKYFNFPGYAPHGGGGVKPIRNLIGDHYGVSGQTVNANGMINAAYFGTKDFLGELGSLGWLGYIGYQKGTDEVALQEKGPLFINPMTATRWVDRNESALRQRSLFTGSGSTKDKPTGVLMIPEAGAWRFRLLNFDPSTSRKFSIDQRFSIDRLEKPNDAYKDLNEKGYGSYLETAANFEARTEAVMRARLELQNSFGSGPETAMFLNTMLYHNKIMWEDGISYDVEALGDEFKEDFGFAEDARLRLARIFRYGYLHDEVLIYDDKEYNLWVKWLDDGLPDELKGGLPRVPDTTYSYNNRQDKLLQEYKDKVTSDQNKPANSSNVRQFPLKR